MAAAVLESRAHKPASLIWAIGFLAVGFASVAWTRLGLAIILPEVMKGIGVTSLAIGGLISTITVIGTGVAEPFLGRLSDILNRRLALTIGLAGFSLFCLLTAFATNLPQMITVRVLLGIMQGMFIPAYLAFVGGAFAKRRGLFLGILVGMFTLGNAIDPLFTRAVYGWAGNKWQAPSVVYGIFGLVLAAIVFALGRGGLFELRRTRREDVAVETEAHAQRGAKTGLASRSMVLLMITMVGWGLTQYGYLGLFVTFLRTQQHFSLSNAAIVLSIAGWVSYFSSWIMGWISDHIGRRYTLLISGTMGIILSYPLFTLTGSFWPAVIIAIGFQSFNGHFYPLGVAYAQDMARAHMLGGHSGAVSGIGHIMAGIAGFVAGSLAASFGFASVGIVFTALSAVMVLCIFLTVDPVYQEKRAERAATRLALA